MFMQTRTWKYLTPRCLAIIAHLKALIAASGKFGIATDIDNLITKTVHFMYGELSRYKDPGIGLERATVECGRLGSIPAWKGDPYAKRLMTDITNQPEWQAKIPIFEGVADALQMIIREITPFLIYATARPESIEAATVSYVAENGCPDATDMIITRPESVSFEDGTPWKAEVLCALFPEVPGIFEDDLKLWKCLLDLGYEGYLFLVPLFGHTPQIAPHERLYIAPNLSEAVAMAKRVLVLA